MEDLVRVEHRASALTHSKNTTATLLERFQRVRTRTVELCDNMYPEDFVVQTMPDVSPTKWHLAHTAWFFESFVLFKYVTGYQSLDKLYAYLFNSYYNAIGEQFCRPRRGQISRPTVEQVYDYRRYVDDHVKELILSLDDHPKRAEIIDLLVLGLNHEQQHQELLVTDIKHVLFMNPLYPALYDGLKTTSTKGVADLSWLEYEGGVDSFGYEGERFHFDNESPRHRRFLEPFKVASRPVTNGEYLEFVENGGYERPDLWLSLGWSLVRERASRELDHERFDKPLYWVKRDKEWFQFTLGGLLPLALDEPVVHVSYFEANAYARYTGNRLPTEFEWEQMACNTPSQGGAGNFQDNLRLHPVPSGEHSGHDGPLQVFGDVWEWTSSAYEPYPGFKVATGDVGEYNGKFMANQLVLRGGSCATPREHIRHTYRNFFCAPDRWQFMGIRLAKVQN